MMIKCCVLSIFIFLSLSTIADAQRFRRRAISVYNNPNYNLPPLQTTKMYSGRYYYWTITPPPVPKQAFKQTPVPKQQTPVPKQQTPVPMTTVSEEIQNENSLLKSSEDIGEPFKRIVPQYKESK